MSSFDSFKYKTRQRLIRTYKWLVYSKRFTRLFGFGYRRRSDQVNILLTNYCHRKCIDCSQNCTQAPSKDKMGISQIKKFLAQSVEAGKKWQVIRITGGEASLDDDLPNVLEEIRKYLEFSPKTKVMLLSNGFGDEVKKRLKKVPKWVEIFNTNKKTSYHPQFTRTNNAPIDDPSYKNADFRNGCYAIGYCGLTITRNGYYPCATSNGIDRVMGLNLGRKNLPDDSDSMREILDKTCRYCGFYGYKKDSNLAPGYRSKSWQKAFKKYEHKKPDLDQF